MSDILDYLQKTDHLRTIEKILEHVKNSSNLNENPFERWDRKHDDWIRLFKENN